MVQASNPHMASQQQLPVFAGREGQLQPLGPALPSVACTRLPAHWRPDTHPCCLSHRPPTWTLL